MSKKFLLFAALCSFLSLPVLAFAQLTVQGTITDSDGSPLPGANVAVVGSFFGASSDAEGNYTILLKQPGPETTIEARFIGYTTVRKVVAQSGGVVDLNFELVMDALSFDDIIVTGSAAPISKRQLGNTISTIKGQALAESGALDVTGSLSGKFAGVQVTQNSGDPAAGISVRLRSASTVNGVSDPLYIIDGVIVNNESNNLLGVASVVQNRLSDINPQDIDRVEVIKGSAAAAIYGSRASNGVVQIFTKRGQRGKPKLTYGTSVNINSLRKKIDYNDAPLKWNPDAPGETIAAERYDYQDMVFRNSAGTDNYFTASGGVENTTYFFSLSNLQNEGIMKGTDFSRSSIRLRVDQIVNDWATFSVGTYLSNTNSHDMPNGGYGSGVLQSILFSDNVTDPQPDEDGNYPSMTFYPNILEYIETYDFQQESKRVLSDFQLTLTPIAGLRLNYVLGYDDSRSGATTYVPLNTTTIANGAARSANVFRTQINSDVNASYKTQLSDEISSVTAVGGSYQFDEEKIATISASSLAVGVKTTAGAATVTPIAYAEKRAIWGGYVQQIFGLYDKLFLTGAARVDGSSAFGVDERKQFYPKASLSYIVSEESFWDKDLINNLKVRAAWGQAGNLTAIGPYDKLTNYGAVAINGRSGLISPSRRGNPGLKPERQTETEVGMDLAMLDNKLGLEVTAYWQKVEDLIVTRTLAPSTGASSRPENVATMDNNGIEIQLSLTPISTPDMSWTSSVTFSANKNEVNGIEGDQISIGNFGFAKAKNGEPLGIFYQGYYARNADGSLLLTADNLPQRERGYVDENGNNVADRDAAGQPLGVLLQKKIGDPNPDFVASWTNEAKYKNWSFRAQFDLVQGVDVLSWDSRMFYRFGGGEQTAKELRGEEAKGTGAAKFGIAEAYIEDGSYIKLRELSVSYLWEKPFKGLSSLRFNLTGRNLLSFDNYSKWDPELNMDAQSNGSRGGIMGLTPIPRVISFGITVAN